MGELNAVSVVLLSLGEDSAARARDSVERQTVPPAAIIEVRDVRPFHAALNAGARQVTTPLFVQVDADMVLDPSCIESLRAAMLTDPSIGVAVGFLRDPLVGRLSGIRMYRRQCFEESSFDDSITPDTDFLDALGTRGVYTVHVLGFDGRRTELLHTFGEHRPDYTARYTWRKFQMEGARYVYRGLAWGLQWHLGVLERSVHPMAALARVAMLQGALSGIAHDQLGRGWGDDGLADFEAFTQTRHHDSRLLLEIVGSLLRAPVASYRACHVAGQWARRREAWPTVQRAMALLDASGAPSRWIAQAGLCRGLMPGSAQSLDADALRLTALMQATGSAESPFRQRLMPSVRALRALLRHPSGMP